MQKQYCTKKPCGTLPLDADFAVSQHGTAGTFEGFGRIDPVEPDVFKIVRAPNPHFDVDRIIDGVEKLRATILNRHWDKRVLTGAVSSNPW